MSAFRKLLGILAGAALLAPGGAFAAEYYAMGEDGEMRVVADKESIKRTGDLVRVNFVSMLRDAQQVENASYAYFDVLVEIDCKAGVNRDVVFSAFDADRRLLESETEENAAWQEIVPGSHMDDWQKQLCSAEGLRGAPVGSDIKALRAAYLAE